jgi:hypothetical protein
MPKDKLKKDRVKKAEPKADPAVLRRFGDLANALGFKSPRILKLLQYPNVQPVHESVSSEGPFLVTSGPGEEKSRRRGVPLISAYDAELEFLFINHLDDENPVRGEGITSFFIRKYIYLAFFGRPAGMPAMHSGSGLTDDDLGGLSPGSGIGGTQQQDQPDGLRTNQSTAAPDPGEEADLFVSDTDARQGQTDREGSEQREREREQQEQEQREREQREPEQREREQRERELRKIEIYFAKWEDDTWKHMPALSVDSENPAVVKETIEAYMTQSIRAFNTELTMMAPDAYYQAVMNDRTRTILLVPQDKISIDNRMIESAAKLREEAIKKVIGLKRTAPDDLPDSHRSRKMR